MEDNKSRAKITAVCEIYEEKEKAYFTLTGRLKNEAALVFTKKGAHFYTANIMSTLPKTVEVSLKKIFGCDGYALVDIKTDEVLFSGELSAFSNSADEKNKIDEGQSFGTAEEKPAENESETKEAVMKAAAKKNNRPTREMIEEDEEENLLDIFSENRINLVNDDVSLFSQVFEKTDLLKEYGEFYAFNTLASDKNNLKVIFNGFSVMLSGMFTGYENIRDRARDNNKKLVGYSLKENRTLSEIIFAVRGKNEPLEQPFGGATGFISYAGEKTENLGYWLLRLDGETGRVKM